MTVLKRLIIVVLSLLMICSLTLAVLITTPAGLGAALWLAKNLVPGELQVRQAEGRLVDRFSLGELRYRDGELDVHLQAVMLDWQPAQLLNATLAIEQLSATNIRISLPAAETDSSAAGDIALPLAIRLNRLGIDELQINAGESQSTLRNIHLSAYTQADRIFINDFSIDAAVEDIALQLRASGEAGINSPWQHDLSGDFTLQLPNKPSIAGEFNSQGDIQALSSAVHISAPSKVSLSFSGNDLLEQRTWQARLQTDDADLSDWIDSASRLSADINANGNGRNIDAQIEATVSGEIEQAIELDSSVMLTKKQSVNIQQLQLTSQSQTLSLMLQGRVDYSDELQLDLDGDWSLETPQPAAGRIEISGSPNDYRLAVTAKTNAPLTSDWQLNATGNRHSLTINKLHAQIAQGSLQAEGLIDWQAIPSFRLSGDWQDIVIPQTLPDKADTFLRLPEGRFDAEGNLQGYHLTSTGRVTGASVPETSWQLQITGDATQARVETLRLELLGGSIQADGEADWRDGINISSMVELNAINPAKHWSEWPGQLNGSSRLMYQQSEQQDWRLTLEQLDLDGRLRDYPVSASGSAVIESDQYQFNKVQLRVADSKLDINGSLKQNSQLDFSLTSPDLAQLWPNASGQLNAEGTVSDDYQTPQVSAQIEAARIQTPWLDVAELSADTDIDTAGDRFELNLSASDLQRDDMTIETLKLVGAGQRVNHALSLDVKLPERQLTLAGHGSWQDQTWSLTIKEGHYSDSVFGDWQIEQPWQLTASREHIKLAGHCWQQQPASLCLGGGWQAAGKWQGQVKLDEYRIDNIAAMDGNTSATGKLALALQAAGDSEQLQQVSGNIDLTDISIQTDAETELRIEQLKVDIEGNEQNGINLTLDGTFTNPAPGRLNGRLQTGAILFDDLEQTPLSGRLQVNVDNLKPWLSLYPRFVTEQASLAADFEIDGTIGNPALDGDLSLTASELGIPELGITLATLQLNVSGQPQQALTLKGKATSGPGELAIDGRIAIDNGALVMPEMAITGERFELINLPEITALASPDLNLNYRDGLLRIEGKVVVPEALIQPFAAPGTIAVAEDEIIVSDEQQPLEEAINIDARIKLELGDKVRVTGNGFESRIIGQLDIRQLPGKPASANGELQLVDGGYSAYGQELSIRKGEIIFTNQPIDNPALDVEAVRQVDNVTVGVRASGTARQPQTELFSTPTMPQADILSYLVTGRPLSGASSGDGNALLRAAAGLGLKQTESLQKTIADTFGIDTLSVDTGTTSSGETDARLTIGKYLAPNLYISYGAGLVDTAVNTVKLRYDINSFLSLEAEQGAGTGVDLLYQIESGDPWD